MAGDGRDPSGPPSTPVGDVPSPRGPRSCGAPYYDREVLETRPATTNDVDSLVDVLSRSFHDDPGTIVFEPDPTRRTSILPVFFRTWLTAALAEEGDLVVPADEVNGLASWFGPDRHEPSETAMEEAGFGAVIEAFGPEAAGRMLAMIGELDARHAQHMSGPHLRLEFFGVDPDVQGRGIGHALIEHGHRRADAEGLACYLETFTERNVRYYEHRGWEVVGTYPVADGVPFYAMRREPR